MKDGAPTELIQEARNVLQRFEGLSQIPASWVIEVALAIQSAKEKEREEIASMIDSRDYERECYEESGTDVLDNVVAAVRHRA